MNFNLICLSCNKKYDSHEPIYSCKRCGGRLKIVYQYDQLSNELDRENFKRRLNGIWKYLDLLPILDKSKIVSLGEGDTRLQKCIKLSDSIGIKSLYAKNETSNPTGSFKDRPAAVGIAKALELEAEGVVIASDGNAAPSTSAYASVADLKCFGYVPEYMSHTRIIQTKMYGAQVFTIKGDINNCMSLAAEAQQKYGWHNLTTAALVNPYQIEGSKTISYEISEQLGWRAPDWIVIPVGGGGLLTANWKGLKEFLKLGFIEDLPKIAGVQADNCAPLVKAYEKKRKIKRWEEKISTVAIPIAVPYPPDGTAALTSIKDSEGTAVAVSDEEILEARRLLARTEAIISEPAGAASFAGVKKLFDRGLIHKSDSVVFEVTGTGLRELKKKML